jgi:hypothetical protein
MDDAGTAQARALLAELFDHVAEISHKIEIVEHHRRSSARGASLDRRQHSELRRELYEVHRLIDGLHRRFPQTDPRTRRGIPSVMT